LTHLSKLDLFKLEFFVLPLTTSLHLQSARPPATRRSLCGAPQRVDTMRTGSMPNFLREFLKH